MRFHRFIGDYDFDQQSTGTIHVSDPRVLRQIRTVLRFKVGDELILCDGKGTDARVRIVHITNRRLEVYIESLSKNQTESPVVCILWCAILKKDSFEWVVQKATEIGVTHIFPIITKRAVKGSLSFSRLIAVAREASEQSGRARVPVVVLPVLFEQAIHDSNKEGITLLCDPSGKEQISHFTRERQKIINLFIGPEGGWDPYEIDRARMSGARLVSLGKTTLRAETAAIVASYMAVNF